MLAHYTVISRPTHYLQTCMLLKSQDQRLNGTPPKIIWTLALSWLDSGLHVVCLDLQMLVCQSRRLIDCCFMKAKESFGDPLGEKKSILSHFEQYKWCYSIFSLVLIRSNQPCTVSFGLDLLILLQKNCEYDQTCHLMKVLLTFKEKLKRMTWL